ncbi:MAG TPA: GIY-YIG nuclease family protein [Patescibacteria group bacterium]|nr:GIY-YIG nuclease family protein [Patescibacteria group bacterium]
MKPHFIYILTNKVNGTLYVGMTENLARRVSEHKAGLAEGFTKKYGCRLLVYYEVADDFESALRREKTIKKWSRQWKLNVINEMNPAWDDLYDSILQ